MGPVSSFRHYHQEIRGGPPCLEVLTLMMWLGWRLSGFSLLDSISFL